MCQQLTYLVNPSSDMAQSFLSIGPESGIGNCPALRLTDLRKHCPGLDMMHPHSCNNRLSYHSSSHSNVVLPVHRLGVVEKIRYLRWDRSIGSWKCRCVNVQQWAPARQTVYCGLTGTGLKEFVTNCACLICRPRPPTLSAHSSGASGKTD